TLVLETNGHTGAQLKPGAVIPSIQMGGTTNRMQLVVDSVGRDLRLVIGSVEKLVKSLDVTVASATQTMKSANTMLASVNQEVSRRPLKAITGVKVPAHLGADVKQAGSPGAVSAGKASKP